MPLARTVIAFLAIAFCGQITLLAYAFAQGTEDVHKIATACSVTLEKIAYWTEEIAYILAPLISLIGVGIIVYFTRKSDVSEQWLKINEAEAIYLQNKLDKFYGPFIVVSESNYLMAQELRSRQPTSENFRLLVKLFDSEWMDTLSDGDRELVREICETGERLRVMIQENIGLVDPEIIPYISRAVAHFRVLHLAHEGKLGEDSAPFLRFVYPKQLDPVLTMELERLQNRVKKLRQEPTTPHGEIASLDLSKYPLDPWDDPGRLA